jgi:uncharacterized membrane protein
VYPTGLAHLVCAAAAIFFGAGIIVTPKGTPRHRQMGRIYGLSMLGLNVTALLIYRLSGTFGPFHVAALLSLLTVIAGVVAVVTRRPRATWLTLHANFMSWSYVGLLAAAAAEAATRIPAAPFWGMVAVASLAVFAVGGYLVITRIPRVLSNAFSRRALPRPCST